MSYRKADLLTKTRRLVKNLALREPNWLKAMEKAPPPVFPRAGGKVPTITLPEDVYVKKFFAKHPDSKHEDAIKIRGFDPVPARVFALRVLELKEQGVNEDDAMTVADMEYRAERKAKKMAYTRLKEISCTLGKPRPSNPYPSAIKEIQDEEKKFVRDRFYDPKTKRIFGDMKKKREDEMRLRESGGGRW